MEQIYIIGDVHGCYKSLLALIEQLPNKKNSKIVFVGDLIDRGKNSCEVIELIINNNYDCVMGNHEELFLEYAPNKDEFGNDFNMENSLHYLEKCGGKATIESYKSKEIYLKHYDFIKNLPLYLEYKDYKTADDRYLVVSHSAVVNVWDKRDSKDKFDIENFENQLLYKRYKQFDNKDIFNVYGHTPRSEAKLTSFDANIDLGCCYKDRNGAINPRLCALEFPSMKIYTQENIE
ncbi:metallophosphoesterase [Aliarcobacter butzleri]|uniref:metallophosphoesterase n=1 Tax=Aliarcobacter butzleri TaxID=28197 RepID=UPI00125F816C|nr:metallophosphoesterase [Aliarcobacter butzleri]MCT7572428.1 metallophosphoesterase [Aliarcobacter butzleri]MCT7647400.1 metallophosphoesterase [Aliarcobacter butzleri]